MEVYSLKLILFSTVPTEPSSENSGQSSSSVEIIEVPSTTNEEQSASLKLPNTGSENDSGAYANFTNKARTMTMELQTRLIDWQPANESVISNPRASWYAQGNVRNTRTFPVSATNTHIKIRHIFHLLKSQQVPLREAVHAFSLTYRLVETLVYRHLPLKDEGRSFTRVLLIRTKYNNQTNKGRFLKSRPDGTWLDNLRILCEKVFRVAVFRHKSAECGTHLVLGGRNELVHEATIAMEGIINYIVNCNELRFTVDRNQFVTLMTERYDYVAERKPPTLSKTADKMRTEMVSSLAKAGVSNEAQ